MTRICITGGPRTGKTTLARTILASGETPAFRGLGESFVHHTDDLIDEYKHLGREAWSAVSQHVADHWLSQPGPWIVEGVAVSRALRKWHEQHPGEPPPVDRVIYLSEPHESTSPGQHAMAKGVRKVHDEIEHWLARHNIRTEYL